MCVYSPALRCWVSVVLYIHNRAAGENASIYQLLFSFLLLFLDFKYLSAMLGAGEHSCFAPVMVLVLNSNILKIRNTNISNTGRKEKNKALDHNLH